MPCCEIPSSPTHNACTENPCTHETAQQHMQDPRVSVLGVHLFSLHASGIPVAVLASSAKTRTLRLCCRAIRAGANDLICTLWRRGWDTGVLCMRVGIAATGACIVSIMSVNILLQCMFLLFYPVINATLEIMSASRPIRTPTTGTHNTSQCPRPAHSASAAAVRSLLPAASSCR